MNKKSARARAEKRKDEEEGKKCHERHTLVLLLIELIRSQCRCDITDQWRYVVTTSDQEVHLDSFVPIGSQWKASISSKFDLPSIGLIPSLFSPGWECVCRFSCFKRLDVWTVILLVVWSFLFFSLLSLRAREYWLQNEREVSSSSMSRCTLSTDERTNDRKV